jgi:tRNA threonylcarbamoyladenosine biosynthesis protein TsaE
VVTQSEAETAAAGRHLAATLQPGDVVLLSGALGAGKTAFVRGLAEGLGADPSNVTSPTFTLIQEYPGRQCVLYHVDLYRLEPKEVDDLGLDELLSQEAIVAVEWPERLPRPIEDAIEVLILYNSKTRREILVTRGAAPRPD